MARSIPAGSRTLARVSRIVFEQLKPFSADRVFGSGKPGNVAAGMCQTRDEAGADRVDDGPMNNRDRASYHDESNVRPMRRLLDPVADERLGRATARAGAS